MHNRYSTRAALLGATILAGAAAAPAWAQEQPGASAAAAAVAPTGGEANAAAGASADGSGDIVVTATRRAVSLQDVPINITAVSSQQLAEQRIDDVRDLAAFTPGLTVPDTGPSGTGNIVLRGLSADDASTDANNTDNALAIYLGEVPLYLDFKLLDINRVETLLGPQGTLYGQGTLAGAIRYLPNRPNATEASGQVHARSFVEAHSSDIGYQGDAVINLPIVKDKVALRSFFGYYYNPGFIDDVALLNDPGTSLPQPGTTTNLGSPAQYDANLHKEKDVNFEKTFTTRNQLMIQPTEDLKAYITYAFQQTKSDGFQANSAGVLGTNKYQNATRYLEDTDRKAHLISLEINANLFDIADLVSTTAYTHQRNVANGDVTDLLLDLDYDYEAFPAFSGYNHRVSKYNQFNQEVRLVSTHGGPFNWVLGGFYNRFKTRTDYKETTPGLADYYGINQPDDAEYVSYTNSKVTEKAIFGEGTLKITDRLQLTAGARYFKYTSSIFSGIALPLLDDDPAYSYDTGGGNAGKSGVVWKFNGSYKFTDGLMVYATYSKGYRIGGPNRVAACPAQIPTNAQVVCALPNELQFGPDTTKNLEVGLRYALFDRKLTGSLAAYRIKWDGIQLASQTQYGGTGITVNGGTAISKGIEFTVAARPTRALTINGSYSYNDAHLTSDVENLLQQRQVTNDYDHRPKFERVDVLAGDRLPGSAKNSGALGATYRLPVGPHALALNWTATYRGNVLTRVGARAGGERLPGYTLHRAAISYETDKFDLTLFANNIFDKYAVSSVGNDLTRVGVNDGVVVRYYSRTVITPRTLGVEGRFKF